MSNLFRIATLDGNVLNIGPSNANIVNIGTGSNTQTINIGTGSGNSTINIGGPGDSVNISGIVTTINATNTDVTDQVLRINKDNVSGDSAGIEILGANNEVVGSVKMNNTSTNLVLLGSNGVSMGPTLTITNDGVSSGICDLVIKKHDAVTLGSGSNGLSLNGQELSLALATTSTAGAMSASDKTSLDSAAAAIHNPVTLGANTNGLSLSGQQLSLALATTTTAGALSASDKTSLDSAVASTHNPVTLGASSNGLSLSGQQLSLALATTSTAGALSAADKTSLDSAAAAIHNPVTLGASANGLSLSGQQLSLALATTTTAGALSAADKTSLNTAVASVHNPVTLGASTNGLSLNGQEISLALATTTTPGAMSAADKVAVNAAAASDSRKCFASADMYNGTTAAGSIVGSTGTQAYLRQVNDFSGSTPYTSGVFTAPIEGYYRCTLTSTTQQQTGQIRVDLRMGSSTSSNSVRSTIYASSGTSSLQLPVSGSFVVQVPQNWVIFWQVNTGTLNLSPDSSTISTNVSFELVRKV